MSARRVLLLALAGSLLTACHVGPQIDESSIGRQPHGAQLLVALNGQVAGKRIEYQGELLDVRDEGLVVLAQKDEQNDSRMFLIPWNRIFGVDATDHKGVKMRASYAVNRRKASVEKLRNVSRFPQGLSPELAGKLLAHHGQTALGTLD